MKLLQQNQIIIFIKWLKDIKKCTEKKIENDIGRFKVDFMMAIYNILCGKRSDNINVDIKECTDKVKILYNAGKKKIGTDEKVFTEI